MQCDAGDAKQEHKYREPLRCPENGKSEQSVVNMLALYAVFRMPALKPQVTEPPASKLAATAGD